MTNPPPLGSDLWINFYHYNLICRGHSVQPLINAVLTHEGFGTQNQNDPATANGHEARRRLAAQNISNDPRAIIESYVSPVSANNLRLLVRDSVVAADVRISDFSADATGLVKDNYLDPAGGCGKAWFLSKPQPLHYVFLQLVYSLPPPIGQICF
jgi:hypothetical protein